MRQKKIFKRRQERHTVKWTLITAGLMALSLASFSAGVQFAEFSRADADSQYADTETNPQLETDAAIPMKVAHSSGRNI